MRYLILFYLLFATLTLGAQDPTMSQYFVNPQLLNPAATGFIPGQASGRVAGYSRSQWAPLSTAAYMSNAVSADFRHCMRNGSWALGGIVQQDGARLGNWKNLRAHATAAYHLKINQTYHLAAGFQAGLLQASLNTNGLMFDQQFTTTGYQSGSSSGENFAAFTSQSLDLHSGLLLYETDRQWVVGLALHHVNRPKYSFFEQGDGRPDNTLDVGFSLHSSFSLASLSTTRNNKHWKGHVLVRKQSATIHGGGLTDQKSQQWQVLGGVETRQFVGLSAGGYLRFAGRSPSFILLDSYIMQLQWRLPQVVIGLSYDLNLWRIVRSNRHNGSLELTAAWRFSEYRKCVFCPR